MNDTDWHDIRASLGGDHQAYARLVERYEQTIFAQMWRFTRDRRILEELVQDVFVEAFVHLAKFRGEAPFIHWLRRIATRVGYRFWKLEARARRRGEILARVGIVLPVTPEIPEPSEAAQALFRMLEHLPLKDRLILTLYYFEDYDTKQIAEMVGWNPTLVRVRMHRACRKLRRLLTDAGYGRTKHE